MTFFKTGFEAEKKPDEIIGGSIKETQGYSKLGFGDKFLINRTKKNKKNKNKAESTILTLNDLPSHTSIDLNFLLAIIDSWDGSGKIKIYEPDFFNVKVDGKSVFRETFSNFRSDDQSYKAPEGGVLASPRKLGFTKRWKDSAYDMSLEPTLKNIAHTSDTLRVEWFASGKGWQGSRDESWAIDNVEVVLNGTTVPEPSTLSFLALGTLGAATLKRKQKAQ